MHFSHILYVLSDMNLFRQHYFIAWVHMLIRFVYTVQLHWGMESTIFWMVQVGRPEFVQCECALPCHRHFWSNWENPLCFIHDVTNTKFTNVNLRCWLFFIYCNHHEKTQTYQTKQSKLMTANSFHTCTHQIDHLFSNVRAFFKCFFFKRFFFSFECNQLV